MTAIAATPVTVERPVFQDWDKVQNAGVARANVAVTEDAPKGTTHDDYARNNAHRTVRPLLSSPPSLHSPTFTRQVLHQHINFFDLSSTGIISPWDTYTAFRLLQWHILLALLATFVIHTGFSYASLPAGHWLPDPLFRIRAAGIHQCKHGGDSGAYDNEGRYRAQQLADFFSKYGDRVPQRDGREGEDEGEWGMTYAQALHGARSQRCLFDFFGTFAALFECEVSLFLFLLFI